MLNLRVVQGRQVLPYPQPVQSNHDPHPPFALQLLPPVLFLVQPGTIPFFVFPLFLLTKLLEVDHLHTGSKSETVVPADEIFLMFTHGSHFKHTGYAMVVIHIVKINIFGRLRNCLYL